VPGRSGAATIPACSRQTRFASRGQGYRPFPQVGALPLPTKPRWSRRPCVETWRWQDARPGLERMPWDEPHPMTNRGPAAVASPRHYPYHQRHVPLPTTIVANRSGAVYEPLHVRQETGLPPAWQSVRRPNGLPHRP